MNLLEDISDKIDEAYFVDLFVRASNTPAIKMYKKLGYVIYRQVLRYYSGDEGGLDMRKADVEKKSIIPLQRPIFRVDANSIQGMDMDIMFSTVHVKKLPLHIHSFSLIGEAVAV
ncbi:hypothetical protein F0562_021261 [Nyssa sinensis]|uniref:N-acetyltransferase domain-containing protein n=1 Tax=Nyssa sinensis TaxID=561372 RepID=A0A5J5BKH8_9ASTE|nr:hypothetical protein F0562_021261 [Nyssa sinensis]